MNNADWWSKKLNPQPNQIGRPDPTPMMPPSQQPMAPMPTFQPNQQQVPTIQIPSASQTSTCPDCGSGNYMSPSREVALRCYDCGYPIQQSGSRYGSLTGAHVEGAAKQAVGNDITNNWNPITSADQAIGRIGG
jgi:hypothetical protein